MSEKVGQETVGRQGRDARSRVGEVLDGAARGAVGAMAMTGMRVLTTELGLVEEPPPQAVIRQRALSLLRRAPRRQRRGLIEAAHWAFGAGAAFGALPPTLRRHRWAGPVYGLAVWLGFELGIAPCSASARPSTPARPTAWRSPPITCSMAWSCLEQAATREVN